MTDHLKLIIRIGIQQGKSGDFIVRGDIIFNTGITFIDAGLWILSFDHQEGMQNVVRVLDGNAGIIQWIFKDSEHAHNIET
jgi:hypothetical protein